MEEETSYLILVPAGIATVIEVSYCAMYNVYRQHYPGMTRTEVV